MVNSIQPRAFPGAGQAAYNSALQCLSLFRDHHPTPTAVKLNIQISFFPLGQHSQ
jgi:hypothetical protein